MTHFKRDDQYQGPLCGVGMMVSDRLTAHRDFVTCPACLKRLDAGKADKAKKD